MKYELHGGFTDNWFRNAYLLYDMCKLVSQHGQDCTNISLFVKNIWHCCKACICWYPHVYKITECIQCVCSVLPLCEYLRIIRVCLWVTSYIHCDWMHVTTSFRQLFSLVCLMRKYKYVPQIVHLVMPKSQLNRWPGGVCDF